MSQYKYLKNLAFSDRPLTVCYENLSQGRSLNWSRTHNLDIVHYDVLKGNLKL
ncbi:MAG: hypothetical protein WBM86_18835 [Waterburya sp.]